MRISTSLRLAALCLLAGSLSASPSPLAAGSPVPEPKKPAIHEEFKGYGTTELAARKSALERACAWLKDDRGLGWAPNPEYLIDHKMVRFGEAADMKSDDPMLKDMKVVTMQLEISTEQARDIHKQAQQQRMKERQRQSLLVLIGIVGLLGVVGAYLRLEDATKGYYTRLLRIAAISALVLIIVAGLCVVG
jgi:hypothetical protein